MNRFSTGSWLKRSIWLAMALLLSASLLSAAAQGAKSASKPALSKPVSPSAPAGMRLVSGQAYQVYTNLTDDELGDLVPFMDSVHQEYQRRFSSFRAQNNEPMPLYLFKTQEDYLRFLKAKGVDARNTGGLFVVLPNFSGLLTWVHGRARSVTCQTLQHEGFHQFAFKHIGGDLPIWINEGLAQYFEDGILIQNRMSLGLANALRIQSVQEALQEGVAFPFDQLLTMTDERWQQIVRSDVKRASLLYDQAWSVTYFLIHGDGGKYRPALEQYLTAISRGNASEQAFRQAFGSSDTTSFRRRWQEYALAQKPDAISVAVGRMEMLGQALAFMYEKKMAMPTNITALERTLKKMGYQGTRIRNGVTTTFDASQKEFFGYPGFGGETARFVLTPAENRGGIPTLIADQLSPAPMLYWSLDDQGKAVYDFKYQ